MNLCDLALGKRRRIVFFTGAGISAESGIPTYRGKGGLWHQYNYEEYACQLAFDRNPEKVWDFHEERRAFVARCTPAEGHRIIADIEKHIPGTTVITQNIDGMHQRAGSRNVIELHGSMWRVRCDCNMGVRENNDVPLRSRQCDCGAYLRPDIVWFDDPLDTEVIERAMRAVQTCDLLITIGTSAMVFPAAQIPLIAMQRKVPTIEINPEKTGLTPYYTVFLKGTAGAMLNRLWAHASWTTP
ncbi:NAD-dependent deacylase [bacterium]|nr:NAD-dependent deacylase [candidate division CSSED10-310 bacterium]